MESSWLNKTESAILVWLLSRDRLLPVVFIITTAGVKCYMAAVKKSPWRHLSVVIFFLVCRDKRLQYIEYRLGLRDVALFIIFHGQTQLNRVCNFHLFILVWLLWGIDFYWNFTHPNLSTPQTHNCWYPIWSGIWGRQLTPILITFVLFRVVFKSSGK